MTQQEIDDVVREQVKSIAEDAANAIRNIVAMASLQIQSQIVNPYPTLSLGIRGIPGQNAIADADLKEVKDQP